MVLRRIVWFLLLVTVWPAHAADMDHELTEARAATLRTLKTMTPAQLATPAWHPALGMTTVEAIYRIMGTHMRDHTRAAKKALRQGLQGRYWADVE